MTSVVWPRPLWVARGILCEFYSQFLSFLYCFHNLWIVFEIYKYLPGTYKFSLIVLINSYSIQHSWIDKTVLHYIFVFKVVKVYRRSEMSLGIWVNYREGAMTSYESAFKNGSVKSTVTCYARNEKIYFLWQSSQTQIFFLHVKPLLHSYNGII